MAGYVTSFSQRHNFNRLWTSILDLHEVNEFHSTDFFHLRRGRSASNPYHGWTSDHRTEFMNDLVEAIGACSLVPFGGAVEMSAFDKLTYEQRRYFTGGYLETSWSGSKAKDSEGSRLTMRRKFTSSGAPSRPYVMAFNLFLEGSLDQVPEGTIVHIILDRQPSLEGYITEYFSSSWSSLFLPGETRLASLGFRDSHAEPTLQAADLFAYVQARRLEARETIETSSVLARLSSDGSAFRIADDEFFLDCWNTLQDDLRNENSATNVTDGRLDVSFQIES